jgi:hypothetical protein
VITFEDIRRFATAFPEVEEFTHFRVPGFKVSGKPFAGMEKGGNRGVFHQRGGGGDGCRR